MKNYLTLFLLFALFFSSCNYIPCSASSDLTLVKAVPETAELTGVYKPDSFTKRDIPGYYYSDSTYLELTKDGKINLKGFAKSTFTFSSDIKDTTKINGDGTWQLIYQKNKALITIQLQLSNSRLVSVYEFTLYKKNGEFVLLFPVGDPDNCTALRLFQQ
jgi:hypothetical protein